MRVIPDRTVIRNLGGMRPYAPWPKIEVYDPDEEARLFAHYRDFFTRLFRMQATYEIHEPDGGFWWWCPGCDEPHRVPTKGEKAWGLSFADGLPTLAPSILVHGWKAEDPKFKSQPRCHSFIRSGKIEFCGDCEHALAGKTVSLPPFNDTADTKDEE